MATDGAASEAVEGERKTVTALLADIKGSTALMEGLDPEAAHAIVAPLLRIMSDVVQRYEGYVARTTGDGIFALFGAPVAYEDHPQRALYAALEMQQKLRAFGDQRRTQDQRSLDARVGVHTGEVVAYAATTGACNQPNLFDRGLTALAEALAAVEAQEERYCESEIYRLKGELLLRNGDANTAEARGCFERAIEIAHQQSAKSYELRATTSLARLLAKQGRREEARTMLAAIYNWFTEGFDTADLKDAKELLDELSG